MPCILAGILAIYGLVMAILIAGDLKMYTSLFTSFTQFGAGLCVGLADLAAGFSIGIVGNAGVRASIQQPKLYVGMIIILILAEVLGLYGLIVALLLLSSGSDGFTC